MTPAAEPALRGSLEEATQQYDAIKAQLKEGLANKSKVDKDLVDLESQIYLYEGSYLNNTAHSGGNVIRGFDTYMKSSITGMATGRNSSTPAPSNEDRIFSTSSATYQRSIALKMNTPATEDKEAGQSVGYKLKRKADDSARN
ncbi:chromatin modification- protein eaf6 [Malassezia vespertilionis]|uniref:Chromatin modification-related protein EAF6 n=1 Tax=Malassezia vespertilionis TaxID=2020962 RepID=A0A2N1J9N5_9BASI|nr:chromatin modification- protein eaf6 [Malassezia vespertilionis]PKI83267.1 hypothetical protein MVES_002836 [Malassezia vespertilionis]WFD07625.1 chromatin modification- protein eaf6 [Malassezia vespertilionis]